jgi:prepilin-type N-terminal cleavage/methylation domain-containing protein
MKGQGSFDMNGAHMGHAGRERGFSLVEVIIAIGVLSGVLISISSMFMLGGKQVKAGKTITEATAISHDIMETFETMSFSALYFDLGAAVTGTTVTVNSTTVGSILEPWQAEIERKLEGGSASATVTPLGPGTPNFGAATALRVQISVTWTEFGRPQTVQMASVRF